MDSLLYDSCPRCGGRGNNTYREWDESTNRYYDDVIQCDPCDGTGNELWPFLTDAEKEEFNKNPQVYMDDWKRRHALL